MLLQRGDVQGAIAQIEEGIALFRSTGAVLNVHYFLALLAEAFIAARDRTRGLAALDEGLALVAKHLDTYFAPELHRLKGDLLLLEPADPAGAESCYRRALDLGRTLKSPYHELRAATSLGRLLASRGDAAGARALLGPIRERSQGGVPRDLREAEHLLATLGR
jgi:hypothetical protein